VKDDGCALMPLRSDVFEWTPYCCLVIAEAADLDAAAQQGGKALGDNVDVS
jgi:hypothetical protein